MGVDLRMEPYAEMFQKERPGLRIIDEFCFLDIDKLFGRLGLSWDDFGAAADKDGRLPHEAALRLLAAVEPHQAPAKKLLILLHYYSQWYEHPDRIPMQMHQFVGTVPGMAGVVGHWEPDRRRSWLVLS